VNDTDFEELPEQEPSWLRLQRATQCRKYLLEAGYLPLPINGKAPPMEGCQDIAATERIINKWETEFVDAISTGILTRTVPAIDIDLMHPEAAAAVEALVREHFGERGLILVRFGKAPKRAILLRTDEPFKKIVRKFTMPDGSEQKIEVLSNGQQLVCYGLHKDTQQPYSWHGGEPGAVKREDLPYVRQADMEAFIDAAAELLVKEFGFVPVENKAQANRNKQQAKTEGIAGVRERAYAEAALEGCAAELAATKKNSRNDKLNAIAFRLGHMVARGWIKRDDVEAALLKAMHDNDGVVDDGIKAAEATLRSGLDAGEKEPHPDLPEEEAPAKTAQPQHPPCTLDQVHKVFRKWFGKEYDTDVIDAVACTAAAERLAGDPLWLLVISGPGNTKTESVSSLSGAGAYITSTISSEGALLSATSRKSRAKSATGGLLRKIGDHGLLVIKDVTSILSADRNTRAGVLAALREIYDGRWERNVGTDGGMSLLWTGRIAVVGAVTTAWDAAHAVISVMGDRFVSIRSDSTVGRSKAGRQAIKNTGSEITMRAELAAAVGGLIAHIATDQTWQIDDNEIERLIKAADIVTYARTAVERDFRGDIIDSHAPEMPTRFAKQLAQMVRGGLALGMSRGTALQLALRCARDSIPQLRLEILLELAGNPRSRVIDVVRNIAKPYRTIRRELEGLHILGLLRCDEEQAETDEKKTVWRYSLADGFDRATLLTMGSEQLL
jgi:hypothetical protein